MTTCTTTITELAELFPATTLARSLAAAATAEWQLCKYADPVSDARAGLSVEDATAVAAEDPALVYGICVVRDQPAALSRLLASPPPELDGVIVDAHRLEGGFSLRNPVDGWTLAEVEAVTLLDATFDNVNGVVRGTVRDAGGARTSRELVLLGRRGDTWLELTYRSATNAGDVTAAGFHLVRGQDKARTLSAALVVALAPNGAAVSLAGLSFTGTSHFGRVGRSASAHTYSACGDGCV